MVKSIGIDPGDRFVQVVALDGSYRKTRLTHVSCSPIALDDDSMRADIVADAVHEALDLGMKGEVTLGHACREAVLRTIELPFKGVDAIKKVVKSEIEGEIHTHSIDDMVVDFHEIGEGIGGGTKILVASVPKAALRNQLESLSAQGVEPASVDLDTMALWRAADWVGAFDTDEDEEGADAAPVHAVVDLGARSVKVILTEGDKLIEMRVLRLGDSVIFEQVARAHGLGLEQVRIACDESLRTGADVRMEADAVFKEPSDTAFGDTAFSDAASSDAELGEVDSDEGESSAPESGDTDDSDESPEVGSLVVPSLRTVVLKHDEVEASHTKYLQRLARELTRFLTASGMAARVRSVWMSGTACRGLGVSEMLTAVFGMAPQELDVLSHLAHDLDENQAAEQSPGLAIAVGLALGPLGGPAGFELRQEDLALTGGFDRLKFPLAIVCMVGLLALFVFANKKSMELKTLELEIGQRYYDPKRPKAAIFHGQLHTLFNGKWFQNKRYFALKSRTGKKTIYSFDNLVADLTAAPVAQRVRLVRDKLRRIAAQKQKQSGVYEEVSLESGLAVLVRWSEVLKSIEPQLGRYLVPSIDIDMKSRKLTFVAAFRGKDFRSRKSVMEGAFDLEIGKPDSPFTVSQKGKVSPPEALFSDREEKGVTGAYYTFTLYIKEVFAPFGPSARVGAAPAVPRHRDYLASNMPARSRPMARGRTTTNASGTEGGR